MRHFLYLFMLCLLVVPACAYNETVSAIAYNPSRTGAYSHLKAVEEATLMGGVQTVDSDAVVNIKSKGNVKLTDTAHQCSNGNCGSNLNKIEQIAPVAQVAANCPASDNADCINRSNEARMGFLHGKITSGSLPSEGNIMGTLQSSWLTTLPQVTMTGGRFTSEGDAYVHQFVNVDKLTAEVTGKLYVLLNFTQEKQQGDKFQLGNITIAEGNKCSGSPCSSYAWQEITATDGAKYQVLVVKK